LCIRERAELKARNRSLLQERRIPLTTHKAEERACFVEDAQTLNKVKSLNQYAYQTTVGDAG